MTQSTSIRHNRFTNTLLIESVLSQIELIVQGINRASIDTHLAQSQLQVAANHLGRLQRYFPLSAYRELVQGLQCLITQLQHSRQRWRGSRFRSQLCHSGRANTPFRLANQVGKYTIQVGKYTIQVASGGDGRANNYIASYPLLEKYTVCTCVIPCFVEMFAEVKGNTISLLN